MWREPTTDDMRDAILEDELLAWQEASVADGKDPTAKSIGNAVGIFRTALRSGFKGRMGVAGTLPHDLIPQAMHVAVFYFLGGRGGARISEPRQRLYADAVDLTKRIADGRMAYTDPDDVEDEVRPSDAFPKGRIIPRRRVLTREAQAGI